MIWVWEASLTLSNLPRRGKTPNLFLPSGIADIPAIAIPLAESPSVSINVHFLPVFPPAQLASSSLAIPVNLLKSLSRNTLNYGWAVLLGTYLCLLAVPSVFFICWSALCSAQCKMLSMTPDLHTLYTRSSGRASLTNDVECKGADLSWRNLLTNHICCRILEAAVSMFPSFGNQM